MVVDATNYVQYAFDGSNIDIPFSLSGKSGMFWLVIDSKLPDAQKPVAIMNGFKGWHFVNGIDTTVYISSSRSYTVGSGLKFPWDGHGNERQYEESVDSGLVPPGTYKFSLIGYDNVSSRETVNTVINAGNYSMPTMSHFYTKDDKTGALLPRPVMMGTQRYYRSGTVLNISGMQFKFTLGDDPFDSSKIVTCSVFGFVKGQEVPDQSISRGAPIYDPHNYDIFYMPAAKSWENSTTVRKYQFVPMGDAIQDVAYGDFATIQWYCRPPYGNVGIMQDDGEILYMNIPNLTPVQYPVDRIVAFPFDTFTDATDIMFDQVLYESYIPNAPPDGAKVQRLTGEVGRMDKGPQPGQFYMTGDSTCLDDLVDCHKMLAGGDKPYSSDGSGYVVWANSNGDYFRDHNSYPEVDNAQMLWSCNSFEPRNINTTRGCPSETDLSGFMCSWLDFAGLYSCALYTQDGSGISYIKFGDDMFSAGGDNAQKKGNGQTLDYDGQFDGLYTIKAVQASPSAMNVFYDGSFWFAWDSDYGTISDKPSTAVEDAAPAAFSVAQNTPNPFNPTTSINFILARTGQVTIDVFNVAGQKVATLADDVMSAGNHSVTWDATGFAAGVYFYTVKSGDYSRTMKMTLLK